MEDELEGSQKFYEFFEIDKRMISSTNVVKRIIREIRRRSWIIGIFSNRESYVPLITCYLIEYSEDWINERSYIKQEKLILALVEQYDLLETQWF
ncbi:MAG: transposase [Candidatus Aminicenantaceae bacterium]